MRGDDMDNYIIPVGKRQRTAKVDAKSKCRKQLIKETDLKTKSSNGLIEQGKGNMCPDESVGRVGTAEYLVENIMSSHINEEGVREYFVKWLGWDSSFNSWEPEENMTGCQDLLNEYWEKNGKVKKQSLTSPVNNVPVIHLQIPRTSSSQSQSKYVVSVTKVGQTRGTESKIPDKETKLQSGDNRKSPLNNNTIQMRHILPTLAPKKDPNQTTNASVKEAVQTLHTHRNIRVLQKNSIVLLNPDALLKSSNDSKFVCVVTPTIEGRAVQRIYDNATIESDGEKFVLCEFEGSNIIEVVPHSCFNKIVIMRNGLSAKLKHDKEGILDAGDTNSGITLV